MRYINYLGTDPATNIATDSWLLYNLKPDKPIFSLWRDAPSVIVGRNQNTFAEVNQAFIDEKGIDVVRRMSGGGAVYHDLGNICFTFFVPLPDSGQVNFKQFVQPMYDALRSLGIEAEISGRNDLIVEGKKISGNAQRYANGYLMHHGTLLWDVDVDTMVRVLNVADEKFISKAAKSVRARVGNIKDYAPEDLTIEAFIDKLTYYLSDQGKDSELILTDEQVAGIKDWRAEKFANWNWNYGESPTFAFNNHQKFEAGSMDVQANVVNGLITDINFVGDFLALDDWRVIKEQFIGQPFEVDAILQILKANQAPRYFGDISNEELAAMFSATNSDNY